MGRWVKVAVAVVAAALGAFLAFELASRDIPPPQDADLIPPAVPAAEAGDAYPVFLKLSAAMSLSKGDQAILIEALDGKAPDPAALADVVARGTEAASLFAELSTRPVFRDPHYRDPSTVGPETPIVQLAPVANAARIASLRADALLKEGRAPEALALALSIVDAGRVFTRSRGPIIEHLVGIILIELGTKRAVQIVASRRLDRARLLAAAARLSAPADLAADLQNALRYEYVWHVHVISHIGELGPKAEPMDEAHARMRMSIAKGGHYIFAPHRTEALYAARYRLIVEEAGKPCLQARVPEFQLVPMGLRPNYIGRVLYNISLPTYDKLYVRRCSADFRLTAGAAAAALQAYRLDHGRFPASLAELTPDYLASSPVDPYNASAPVYSAETGEIHSAGKDADGNPL